jgi:SPP1 family predicted phage head-tail adaptor
MADFDNLTTRLRHRVQLQAPVLTEQEAGQYALSWQDVATLWVEITPLKSRSTGQESVFAEQQQANVSHEVLMRYRSAVNAQMRLVFGDRLFNIRHVVNPGERNVTLRLLCEENVAT